MGLRTKESVAFTNGSFDPFTNGHLHVISKATQMFDKVVVGIGVNPDKTRKFDKNVMKKAMEKVFENRGLNNVEVITYENLSVEAAAKHNATYLVRGIRNGTDYQYEENLAVINEEISKIDTIYIRAGKFGAISSSMVRELLKAGRDVSKYVPEEILEVIKD